MAESVPPKKYGGTERIVSCLTEELVSRGHHVTLFASGDSQTNAWLIPVCYESLRQICSEDKSLIYYFLQIEEAAELSPEFDLLHFHNDFFAFSCIPEKPLRAFDYPARPPRFARARLHLRELLREATRFYF